MTLTVLPSILLHLINLVTVMLYCSEIDHVEAMCLELEYY